MITLTRRSDIEGVFLKKNRLDAEDFYVLYTENQVGYPRFAFITSKKFFKKATSRNRAKRLLRQAVRSAITSYEDTGCDILFIAKVSILKKKSYDIIPQIREVFDKIKQLCLRS